MRIKREIVKTGIFVGIFSALFTMLNAFLQPVWTSWNNYSTLNGFYKEPPNTIETVFLGSSYTVSGFTPMELYEDYGICAYNLGSEQQPMLASYYWLLETYRYHSESLTTVVLQCAMLNRTADIALYRKAIDAMHFSTIKYHAVEDYVECAGNKKDAQFYYLPFFAYHDRWSTLEKADFEKTEYPVERYVRGYCFSLNRYLDSESYNNMAVSPYILDAEAEPAVPNDEAIRYLKKMIDFCTEKGLKLVLVTTPGSGTASEHYMLSEIAEEYGLEYLDFNYEPLSEEVSVNRAIDFMDSGHMNYYGAKKLTHWFGKYLQEKCDATDVRGDTRYLYMEELLKQYHKEILDVTALKEQKDLVEYLKLATGNEDYSIILAVKDEGSQGLEESTKAKLSDMGFEKLSVLGYRDSYLALFEGGRVIVEISNGQSDVRKEGKLTNGRPYTLMSGGAEAGNRASCIIDGREYARNARGINLVVYNNRTKSVVDSAVFDTYVSGQRESGYLLTLLEAEEAKGKTYPELSAGLQKLYLYNKRSEYTKKVAQLKQKAVKDAETDFLTCLNEFWNDKNIFLFLAAGDDTANFITRSGRRQLQRMGLSELSELKTRDVYVGTVCEGKVCLEKRTEDSVYAKYLGTRLLSKKTESSSESCIMTDNFTKITGTSGMNVVVYDAELKMIIYSANFSN